ncbi:11740_t:CDS:1, partial [Entrophospora sp. SA101]
PMVEAFLATWIEGARLVIFSIAKFEIPEQVEALPKLVIAA